MSIGKLKEALVITGLLFVVIFLLGTVFYTQTRSYQEANRKNCKQYEVIPEKYIDKIPSGCVAQYFEAKR